METPQENNPQGVVQICTKTAIRRIRPMSIAPSQAKTHQKSTYYLLSAILWPVTIYFLMAKFSFWLIDGMSEIVRKCNDYCGGIPFCSNVTNPHINENPTHIQGILWPLICIIHFYRLYFQFFWSVTYTIFYFTFKKIVDFIRESLLRIWITVCHFSGLCYKIVSWLRF